MQGELLNADILLTLEDLYLLPKLKSFLLEFLYDFSVRQSHLGKHSVKVPASSLQLHIPPEKFLEPTSHGS